MNFKLLFYYFRNLVPEMFFESWQDGWFRRLQRYISSYFNHFIHFIFLIELLYSLYVSPCCLRALKTDIEQDTDLRVVAEALDKLFDVFSEDDTDAIFFQLNLLQKMRGIANSLKIKMATQKRNLSSESLGIVNMAKLNLQRFIKYKEKRPKI